MLIVKLQSYLTNILDIDNVKVEFLIFTFNVCRETILFSKQHCRLFQQSEVLMEIDENISKSYILTHTLPRILLLQFRDTFYCRPDDLHFTVWDVSHGLRDVLLMNYA